MTPVDVLKRVIGALDSAGIEYMLTGSFASSYHGAPRATQDLDIVISATPAQLRSLTALLPESEFYFDLSAALGAHGREGLFNIIDLASGWKIDLIIRKSRPFSRTEFDRRAEAEFEGMKLRVASASGSSLFLLPADQSPARSAERSIPLECSQFTNRNPPGAGSGGPPGGAVTWS